MKTQTNTIGRRRPLNQNPTAIKVRRLGAELDQSELARRAGTTPATISRIEGGTRSASGAVLRRVANALGCTVVDLLAKDLVAKDPAEPELGEAATAEDAVR